MMMQPNFDSFPQWYSIMVVVMTERTLMKILMIEFGLDGA
jgi:hypothetical protein